MANPTISGSLNKTTVSPGEQLVATIQYADADNSSSSQSATWTVTDQDGNTGTLTLNFQVNSTDALTLSVTDDSGRVWTKQSDDGATAVYTATA